MPLKNTTIAVLEDDLETAEEIREALTMLSAQITIVSSAGELFELSRQKLVDIFLVDLGLPDASGLDVVRAIRTSSSAGVIILSGRVSETDLVVGLELGADDYIKKPFSPRELSARVSSLARRLNMGLHIDQIPEAKLEEDEKIEFGGWTLSTDSRQLFAPDGALVATTTSEYELLKLIVSNPGRVLSRETIIVDLKGYNWAGYDRAIDGLVSRLRKKIKKHEPDGSYIKTVHGIGYVFNR